MDAEQLQNWLYPITEQELGLLLHEILLKLKVCLTDTPLPSVGQLQTLEIWGTGLMWVMVLLVVLLFDLLDHLISRTSSKHRLSILTFMLLSQKDKSLFPSFKAKINPQWGYWKSRRCPAAFWGEMALPWVAPKHEIIFFFRNSFFHKQWLLYSRA